MEGQGERRVGDAGAERAAGVADRMAGRGGAGVFGLPLRGGRAGVGDPGYQAGAAGGGDGALGRRRRRSRGRDDRGGTGGGPAGIRVGLAVEPCVNGVLREELRLVGLGVAFDSNSSGTEMKR